MMFYCMFSIADQNKHVSKTSSAFHKDEHSPLVKIRSMDNLQSVSIAKDSSTVDFGRTLEQSHPGGLVHRLYPRYPVREGNQCSVQSI